MDETNFIEGNPPTRFSDSRSRSKIIISFGVLGLVFSAYGCSRILQSGAREASILSEEFHGQTSRQEWAISMTLLTPDTVRR